MPRRGFFEEKIVDAVARLASGLIEPGELRLPFLAAHTLESILRIGLQLRAEEGAPIYCRICGRGPFTKKGYYLHLVRVHYYDLLSLVREESERVGRASRL